VADATRDRIKTHARAIGYIYNRRAASLRTSRSGILGVVVHDIMNRSSPRSALDRERARPLAADLPSVQSLRPARKAAHFVDTLLQLGADGVIMSPAIGTPPEDIRTAEENGLLPPCSSPATWRAPVCPPFAATTP
jgi:DNA-binding LacI/PurR family transcriptional regulator